MKTAEVRTAIVALFLTSAPGLALAQEAPPPGAPRGQGGPRMMPASDKAKTFDSKSLGATVTYVAYLPADYETSKKAYPVVYALHGMFENSAFLERRGVLAQYDDLRKSGELRSAMSAKLGLRPNR